MHYVHNLIIFRGNSSNINRWTNLNESIRSGMAVLDVTIPTGYWVQQQKLDAYILSRRVRNLQRARYQHNKVLFYFDYVSCISFFLLLCHFEMMKNGINVAIFVPIAARSRRHLCEFHNRTMVSSGKYVSVPPNAYL